MSSPTNITPGVAHACLICRPNSHPFNDRTLTLDQPVKVICPSNFLPNELKKSITFIKVPISICVKSATANEVEMWYNMYEFTTKSPRKIDLQQLVLAVSVKIFIVLFRRFFFGIR